MALSGSVESDAWTGEETTHKVILSWTATQSKEDNTSTVSWTLKSSASGGYVKVSELRVTIDGDVEFYRDSSNHTNGYNGTVLASGTKTITHNDDGSRKFTIKIEAGIYVWAINKSGEKEFTLTAIPRASDISANNAEIGDKSTIVVTKKSSSYTHSIQYKFGNLSGYINASGITSTSEVKFSATSISFTIPTSFYAQIPNAKEGTCELICTTYSGTTKIGDAKSTTFKVKTTSADCAPSVEGTVADSNATTKALTGDETTFIKYFSNALCTIKATAKNSATIKTKKIGGTTVTGTTRTISKVEVDSVTFEATDSRGYATAVPVAISLIPYRKLTANVQLNRVDPVSGEAILTIKGNYFNGSFGATDNQLTCYYRVAKTGEAYGDWIQVVPTISGNYYNVAVDLTGLDYQHPYSAEVLCSDKLMSLNPTAAVGKGVPLVDWGENDWRFNVPFLIPTSMYGSTLPENPKKGQVFFLKGSDGTYAIKVYDGTSW